MREYIIRIVDGEILSTNVSRSLGVFGASQTTEAECASVIEMISVACTGGISTFVAECAILTLTIISDKIL